MCTSGADNVADAELVQRYGDALRAECAVAGFQPACDLALRKQSTAARYAATQWAARVLAERRY